MQIKKILSVLVVGAILILNGCASFSQNEVAPVNAMPDVSKYSHKPSVYVEIKFMHGAPGSSNLQEISSVKDKLIPVIAASLKDSQLFSEVTFDEFKKSQVDYTLKLDIYNHGNNGAAAVSGFLTGFTLGVIPGMAVDHYTLTANLLDKSGSKIESISNEDSVKTWIGIWFIPVMANSPEKAVTYTLDNQIKAAIKSLVESGKLKYSLLQYYQVIHNA